MPRNRITRSIRVQVGFAVIGSLASAAGPRALEAGPPGMRGPGASGLRTVRAIARRQDIVDQALTAGLDPAFGVGGKISLALGPGAPGNGAQAQAMAIQQDGKIVVAGFAWQNGTSIDFAITRFNQDGSLDQSFGTGGKVSTDFFGMEDEAQAIAIQQDGKIVVAGRAAIAAVTEGVIDFDFALARYNSDGSLDSGFGSAGRVTTHFADGRNLGQALLLQPDGKLVVAGAAPGSNGESDFALARYNSDGSLDPFFGTGGMVRTDFFGKDDAAFAIAIQPDGKLIAAGEATGGVSVIGAPTGADFALARYNPNGSLDTAFGTAGKVTTDFFGANDICSSVACLATGKIVVAGVVSQRRLKQDIALARYNSDGTLDATFGAGGEVLSNFASDDAASALAVQRDGRLVVAGTTRPFGAQSDFEVVRFDAKGALDTTFGTGGRIVTDFLGQDDAAFALGIQNDGKIVAAGTAVTPTTGDLITDFAIARYASPVAQPDFALSFGESTITVFPGGVGGVVLNIERSGGFTGNVTVTAPDTSGIKVKLDPPSQVVTGATAVFSFKVKRRAPLGTQTLVFTGKDDSGRLRTATLTMNIQSFPQPSGQ